VNSIKTNNIPVNGFLQENSNIRLWLVIISAAGMLLRLFHYFYNRSLWMDEVYLSSSFLHFSYAELATKVLDHDQKAPIGFLWMVKFTVDLFGKNEMALRTIPLVAGVISVVLYPRVTQHFLKPGASILATLLFAFAPALVYHSVEIKQYSTECLATVFALYLFIRYKDQTNWRAKILWGVFGALTLWFSYSVIFVLAGIGAGVSLDALIKKNWKVSLTNLVPFSFWLISFVVSYLLFTHRQAESQWVVYFFKTYGNFMPMPPHNLEEVKWFPRNLQQMMDYPMGLVWDLQDFKQGFIFKLLSIPVLPVILMVAGIVSLFRSDRINFYILIFPVLLMLFASGIYLYPLIERFWVFITPVFFLFIGYGFEFFTRRLKQRWLTIGLFVLISAGPVLQSAYFIVKPEKFYKHKKSLVRESLVAINTNFKEGDAVYNYWNNYPGFDFYRAILPLKFIAVEGRDVRNNFSSLTAYNQHLQNDFKQFKGKKRVWVIYNSLFLTDIGDLIDDPKWYYKNNSPTENLVTELKKIGKPVQKTVYPDVTVYLFELY
jgi:4-amino-4-deoxy-L-arabinose transferase-like glycosyltransferase